MSEFNSKLEKIKSEKEIKSQVIMEQGADKEESMEQSILKLECYKEFNYDQVALSIFQIGLDE